MDLNLAGKTALVTGASKGIGLATAQLLASEGCNVILVSRTAADLDAACEAIRKSANVRVEAHAADLSKGEAVAALAQKFPDVDILVNNAGAIPGGKLADIDEAKWRAAWDLKVFGYINMCREYFSRMSARGSGVIVNIIGNAAKTRDSDYICGVTGNAALEAFTRSLGHAGPKAGVRVLGIHPGPVATDRLVTLLKRKATDKNGSEDTWQDLLKPMPGGRAAKPEEIAAMAAFLASDRSGYTSGAVISIDNGASQKGGAP